MRVYKRRAIEMLDLMRQLDPDAQGVSLPTLKKASGWSRSTIRLGLIWLEDTGAVRVVLDDAKRRLWVALPDDEEPVDPEAHAATLAELGLDGDIEQVLSSLTS